MNIRRTIKSIGFGLNRQAPTILVIGGVIGDAVGTVMACLATRRIDDILKDHAEQVTRVQKKHSNSTMAKDEKRELASVYLSTGRKVARLYAPSAAVCVISTAGILAGHGILRTRTMALATAYASIDAGFKRYRGGVIERFGKDVDREIRADGHLETIEVAERDANGAERTVEKKKALVASGMPSDYARYFGPGLAKAAEPNDDYNLFFLRAQQEIANTKLRADGYLFLNDVYDMLGIARSKAGQIVGWIYDKNTDDHGDNFIDFGIQEIYRELENCTDGYERVYLLDFNVDGPIMEQAIERGLIAQ